MQDVEKFIAGTKGRWLSGPLLAFGIFLALSAPALAAEVDPFQIENTHWMSFDRYKDQTKNGATLPQNFPQNETAKTETNAVVNIPEMDSGADGSPAVAAPTRPINPPVMPGMNKDYDIKVTSTETEKPPVAQITHIDSKPTVHLPEMNWQSAADVARQSHGKTDSDDVHTPLDVRMSFLPNEQMTPTPSPASPTTTAARVKAAIAAANAATAIKEAPKSAADAAACAAIDAYKKKQLEALQGDRQTLAALQAAIAQLGLQKQLNFMAGADPNISTQADNAPTYSSSRN